ncbi:unnamed protein product, partial [Brassica rapa subsp. trilocularis]
KCFESSSASKPKLNRRKAASFSGCCHFNTTVYRSGFEGLVGLLHKKSEPTQFLYPSLRVRIRLKRRKVNFLRQEEALTLPWKRKRRFLL